MSAERDPLAPQENPKTRVPLRIEEVLLACTMAAIALITGANVFTRYTTNMSLAFTEEYSVALMVVMALIGSAAACATDRHIRMTFFVDKLGPGARRRVELACVALSIVMFATLAWLGTRHTWDEYRFEVLSPGLGVPQWLYTAWLPLLAALCVLRLLGRLLRVARG